MPNLTVVIDCDEQGNYSVGSEPHAQFLEEETEAGQEGGQGAGDQPGAAGSPSGPGAAGGAQGAPDQDNDQPIRMEPCSSLDEALSRAKELFSKAAGGEDENPDEALEAGYKGVAQGGGA